jgi:hypothetical protein
MSPSTAVATDAFSITITLQERAEAETYLKQSLNGIIGAIKGLSDAQWNFVPSPNRWSIAQVVQHVNCICERLLGPVKDRVAEGPPPDPNRNYKLIDRIVIGQFPNRLVTLTAPDFAQPTGSPLTVSAAITSLTAHYASLTAYLRSTPDLRNHVIPAAPLQALTGGQYDLMDGYQWIMAGAAHGERHTKQILEIRADDRFPAD